MSYLLEALQKADQERDRGHIPDIATQHELYASPAKTGVLKWWLVGGMLLLNAGFLFWYVQWQQRDDGTPVTRSASPVVLAPETEPARQSTPVPQPLAATVPSGTVPSDPAPTSALIAARPIPPESLASREMPAESAPAASKPVLVAPPAPDFAPSEAAFEPAPDPAPPPSWQDLPPSLQQLVVRLSLDVHVYSDRPEQRFVLVNMRKYRQGETLREGPLVEEIHPGGVILLHQDSRFQLERQ